MTELDLRTEMEVQLVRVAVDSQASQIN
jgi:hypothetical protein